MRIRLDRYTQRAQEAIVASQEVAQTYNHSQIEPEHLLLALLEGRFQRGDTIVADVEGGRIVFAEEVV